MNFPASTVFFVGGRLAGKKGNHRCYRHFSQSQNSEIRPV